MRRAERMLLDDAPLAPLYYVSSRNLVDPQIANWINNPGDNHGAHWLCRAPPSGATVGAAAS
jgi:ABC-type oligopeptide transport system substrate-binding subunit